MCGSRSTSRNTPAQCDVFVSTGYSTIRSKRMSNSNSKPARCLRVLLSEDREDDALLIVDELVQAGYRIEWKRVETPDEMRALLSAESWDLIIADYDLPRFS